MEIDPETQQKVYMKLYTHIKNASQLREKLVKGELKCTIVKPSLICDPFQVVAAVNKAFTSEILNRNCYVEVLYCLGNSKNNSSNLVTFGFTDNCTSGLVVTVSKGDNDEEIYKHIEGDEVPLDRLSEFTDKELIRKTYKIGDKESGVTPMLDSVVSRIATKDFL
ncbi:unnamed protein product [Diabrotica balteata]|uniref:Uncharacterized protein n=1 Tax=Diabrotica balteata TaxID=107213 RepID=A0A9N9T0M6_DIABA|nr:unnamed protein product [Diabrotica balteata]